MKKFYIIGGLFLSLIAGAAIAGTTTTNYPSLGSQVFFLVTNGSSQALGAHTMWDYAAGANGWSINASHQGSVSLDGGTGATVGANQSGTWTVGKTSLYPANSTPITASATGTTGATTATLAGTSGKTTYMCTSSIRANATAATTVTNTFTGVISGTLSHIMWVAPAASGIGVDEQVYNPCVPASTTNTGIAGVSGAPGTGGAVSVVLTGYQL